MNFDADSSFELLREQAVGDHQFDGLTAQYKRLGNDYAALASSALMAGAIWDGGGVGAAIEFWNRVMSLEQKREGIRVGDLGMLLNAIESAGEDLEMVLDIADKFAADHNHDPQHARRAIVAELLRRYVVNGITILKNDGYGVQSGPYEKVVWDEQATKDAQKLLRLAVGLNRK